MQPITAAAIQFNVTQGNVDANLAYVREALARVAGQGANLAVLPEMWSTGFAYKTLGELAQRTESIVTELCELSALYKLVIIGSQPEPAKVGGSSIRCMSLITVRLSLTIVNYIFFPCLGRTRRFKVEMPGVLLKLQSARLGLLSVMTSAFPNFPAVWRWRGHG